MNKHDEYKEIINNPALRRRLASESHYHFFHLYFPHYIEYPTADFQKEIFSLTQNNNYQQAVIVAFRGSAKSTIVTLSNPIWSIVGKPQKKFVLIVSQTQQQARFHLSNIKEELEQNTLLTHDFNIHIDHEDEWRYDSLVLSSYGARIHSVSIGESMRGLREKQYRPDLIICDDIEDLNSVKTQESRDYTFDWFNKTLVPMGKPTTKIIVVGNLLHEDSFIMRMKEKIKNDSQDKVYKSYPLIDENGKTSWLGKYPTQSAIEREKSMLSYDAWMQEYLLKIIRRDDQVVQPEWIGYYDELPSFQCNDFQYAVISMDLAIKEKESADYTAMVTAYIYGYESNTKIYILPFPVNTRIDFPKTISAIKEKYQDLTDQGLITKVFVEEVGYQGAITQQLMVEGIKAIGITVAGQDKRARLAQTTGWIQSGKILFPKKGCEFLINQLIYFGVEKHDDLADAFSLMVLELMKNHRRKARAFPFKPFGF
jgi:predicted phage terminase large subunit-like protein